MSSSVFDGIHAAPLAAVRPASSNRQAGADTVNRAHNIRAPCSTGVTPHRTPRLMLVACAVLVIAAGLVARFAVPGLAGDLAGGILYAALVYLVIAVITPRSSVVAVALIAFGLSALIELLQLTPLPATWGTAFPPARLVFGSTFVPLDFVAYAIGAAATAAVDRLIRVRN